MHKKIITLIATVLIISACKSNAPDKDISGLIESRMGQVVLFPETLYATKFADSVSTLFKHPKNKVINFTDGDCGACIAELYKWEKYILDNPALFNKTQQMFIIYSDNYPRFEFNVEKAGIALPYYYDSLNSYTSINHIDETFLQTLLIDKSNKITLIGSPIDNPAMQKLYRKVLSE